MKINSKKFFRIYKPTKTLTQSGLINNHFWYLKVEDGPYYIDPFMGWFGSKNPKYVILKFKSLKKAILYAKKLNVNYIIEKPKKIERYPKFYEDNFISK